MKYTLQVVIMTDDGQTETRELASLERERLSPTTLGLTRAEGKTLLKALQEIVVERQLTAYLATQRPCARCGTLQHSYATRSSRNWNASNGFSGTAMSTKRSR
jgi:hypothetical protein